MFEFSSDLYLAVIAILGVLLLGLLIERLKYTKKLQRELQALAQKLQQQRQHEFDIIKKQQDRQVAAIKAKFDDGVHEERARAERIASDLEREREISRIASTVSNEQAKKIQFFTDLAQEFRNPLSRIMESLEDLLAGSYGKLQTNTRKQLEVMLRNTRLLLRGMDLFHDISYLQSGKMEIARSQQDLVPFLKEIVQTVAWYADKKKIDLRLETSEQPIEAFFDATKIAEVVYHLLSNAFKFTESQGKILISVSDRLADEEVEEDSVQISIRNSGKPIAAEDIPFLFDPFHRAERDRPRFGLSLVKELISQHGGKIAVRNVPDIGTEFTILLPKGTLAESATGAEDKKFDLSQRARMELSMLESEEWASDHHEGRQEKRAANSGKILIVEDNESLRELLKSGLRDYFTIMEAQNGVEAFEKLQEVSPDLIITDVKMPEMDGLNLCKKLKSDPSLNHIPVILITAKSSEGGRLEGMEAGADAYIAKPFGFEELLRKVEHLTKQSVSKA